MTVRAAFVGDEPLVAQCADIAAGRGIQVVLLATANPLVATHATSQQIPVVGSQDPRALVAALREHPADVLLSIAYLRIVPDEALGLVRTAINFHDGPLPGYAGLNVTTWALLAGEPEHGITWHHMTSDVDAGAVVHAERFAVADDETAFSLNARCYEAALASFPIVADAIAADRLPAMPQPAVPGHVFRRSDRPARLLDLNQHASDLAREVRALDLGHRLPNTVGAVRMVLGSEAYVVDAAKYDGVAHGATAGTVVRLDGSVTLATGSGTLTITALSTPEGATLDPAEVFRHAGFRVGEVVPAPSLPLIEALARLEPELARDEQFWLWRAASTSPTVPPVAMHAGNQRIARSFELPPGSDDASVLAAVGVWLARTTDATSVALAVTDQSTRDTLTQLGPLARPPVLVLHIDSETTSADLRAAAAQELALLGRRRPLLRDAIGRQPATRGQAAALPLVLDLGSDRHSPAPTTGALRLAVTSGRLVVDSAVDAADPDAPDRIGEELQTIIASQLEDPTAIALGAALIGPNEQRRLDALNATELEYDRGLTIDGAFRRQVADSADRPALTAGRTTLSYGELLEAVDELANRLQAAGVKRGDLVGIAVPRGTSMVAGVLATLSIGAAYVPLDPAYPLERLEFMVDDAGLAALLAAGETADRLQRPGLAVVQPSRPAEPAEPPSTLSPEHGPGDLAYVIYTSGSTGRPKGVMLEHRQVSNFFAAMDQVIAGDPPGVWLAVTSLSFDISVLELLWTLTRGFHVVLKSDRASPSSARGDGAPLRPVTFSLFYFAAGEEAAADGYRLLLDSARFADRHGFEAVWTPERHFHAFGGAYPNPSVTGAALAATTEHVGIRAGSVVLPLHSPVRVAEEWAVVDNLSRGRVAISFAAGWQPNDFVLNPGAYATAKEDLPRSIDQVQRLWRGETVDLPGHDGALVEVRTLPRPVQAELPVWLTSAGSPATFERAGTLGVNVLTHLLGQSIDQLTANIDRYRSAWRAAGHHGEGRVTLMMHTYLDRDAATAREVARQPMKGYLSTAVGLLRDVASAFPTFAGRGKGTDDLFASLTAEELDQLLEVAAQRYLQTSGLFGTAADVADVVEALSAAGADEIACLIDFGVQTDDVLRSLDRLLEAKQLVADRRLVDADVRSDALGDAEDEETSVAALVARHGVTHLQCTPSLAAMLVADTGDRAALRQVHHLMLGGEALPTALAAELRTILPGRFTNMYGPTETTIWSLTHEIDVVPDGAVPIGTPIANTTVFVLDTAGRPVPLGGFGELHIGGEGVARGYHERPELTAERFVERAGMGRVYSTGDVAQIDAAGIVQFAGRADTQVKIRGHRIELGEIEAVLDRHPSVMQSVVVPRGDDTDVRLVAFVVFRPDADGNPDSLRTSVARVLPEAMVPSAVVPLRTLPLTPNGKVDRKALPTELSTLAASPPQISAPPADDAERLVAEIWSTELDRPVGRDDNFFDIGGHSLLAVKVFRRVSDETGAPLALTDIFRFPTVRTFAAHLEGLRNGPGASEQESPAAGTDRGAMRRRAMARRGGQ